MSDTDPGEQAELAGKVLGLIITTTAIAYGIYEGITSWPY